MEKIIGVAVYEVIGHEEYSRNYVYFRDGKKEYTSVLAFPAEARELIARGKRIEKVVGDGKVRCRVYMR